MPPFRGSVDPQVLQLLQGVSRQTSAAIRQQRQIQQREKEFKANLDLREQNLKLREEQLDLDRQKAESIERERVSKQEARAVRAEKGRASSLLTKVRTATGLLNSLNKKQRDQTTQSVTALNKELLTLPLQSEQGTALDQFSDRSIPQLARSIQKMESRIAAFDNAASPLFLSTDTEKERAGAELDAAREALEIRQSQFELLAQSRGPQLTNDPAVAGNIVTELFSQIGTELGVEVPDISTGPGADTGTPLQQSTNRATLPTPVDEPGPPEDQSAVPPPTTQELIGQIDFTNDAAVADFARQLAGMDAAAKEDAIGVINKLSDDQKQKLFQALSR